MEERMKKYGPYLVFLAAMLWASDAPFRIYLTEGLSSTFIVLAEHLIDVVIILPILFFTWREIKRLNIKQWGAVIFIGVGGSALALILFTQAFTLMNPSVTIVLQKIQPFIAIWLAVALLKESIGKRFWLWALIGIAGAYLVSFPNLVPQLYEGEVFNPHVLGVLFALGAAVLWAASTVFGRYVLNTISFKAMTALRFSVAFIFLLIWNFVNGDISEFASLSPKDWLFIAIISVTSGVVALFVYYRGLQNTKASIATIAELGFPVMAVIVNYVFLDAALAPMQMLGIVVILFAVFRLSKVNATQIT